MNQLNYYINLIKAAPFLPLLRRQANHILNTMPDLPAPEDTHLNVTEKSYHIVSLGESSMASIGVDSQQHGITGFLASYIEETDQKCSYEIAATSGYTAQKVKDILLPTINSPEADVILIGLGANDSFQVTSPKKWRQNLEGILKTLRQKFEQTPIVFINMPPIKEFPIFTRILKYFVQRQLYILRAELESLIKVHDQVYFIEKELTAKGFISEYNLHGKVANDFYSDGVHPSKLTYKYWGKEIFTFLKKESLL